MPTQQELQMLQALPLDVKVMKTKQRIREWVNEWGEDKVYVAYSGGKDSTVLLHIAKSIYPNIKSVFVNTGLEFQSVRERGMGIADIVIRPEKSFVQIITQYGYPIFSKEVSQNVGECQQRRLNGKEMPKYRVEKLMGTYIDPKTGQKSQFNMAKYGYLLDAPFRLSQLCCNWSKKNPSKNFEKETGMKPILGIMAEESRLRTSKWLKVGCNAFSENRPTSQPLSFWKEQDILRYIKQNNIQIADIYKDLVFVDEDGMEYENEYIPDSLKLKTTGANRTGCIYCMFGINQDLDKFVRLKQEEPVTYDYVMRGGSSMNKECGFQIKDLGTNL